MSDRKVYEVLREDDKWKVQLEGASRASSVLDTKAEAVERGRELAKAAGLGQLRIKKMDNTIETEWTYGADPRRYKG